MLNTKSKITLKYTRTHAQPKLPVCFAAAAYETEKSDIL